MTKNFKSWKRAERRGHLTLDVFRDTGGNVHSRLVHTVRRNGPGDPKREYMRLASYAK